MTYRPYRPPRIQRPTKRALRANALWLQGDVAGLRELAKKPPTARGRQPESYVNDEIGAWRNRKPGLLLERNKRRLATPVGYHKPIMLGWLADDSGDWIGGYSHVVTPADVGRTMLIFTNVETKRRKGVKTLTNGQADKGQRTFIERVKRMGGIAGVARSPEDCERLLAEWENGGSGG